MQRIQRAVALVLALGALATTTSGCAGTGNPMGTVLNLALGVGAAVGSYYLAKELFN